jgi:hypothetical protein
MNRYVSSNLDRLRLIRRCGFLTPNQYRCLTRSHRLKGWTAQDSPASDGGAEELSVVPSPPLGGEVLARAMEVLSR